MPRFIIPPETIERAKALRAEGRSLADIAAQLKISAGSASAHTRGVEIPNGQPKNRPSDEKPLAPVPSRKFEETEKGQAECAIVTPRLVRTVEDALRVAEVDAKVWFVKSWQCTQWSVMTKERRPDGDESKAHQMYRVLLKLERIAPRAITDALDALYARLAKQAPKWPAVPRRPPGKGEPTLAVLGLFDVHFGKLAWGPETGSNYDLKIASQVFAHAVDDLMGESSCRNVSQILLPIGNDFFHMDNARNTTFAGTPQDVDGRYAKVFEVGFEAVIKAVNRLVGLAPVHIEWVPGNHDPTTSYHLVRTLQAHYRNCPRVTVSVGAVARKYYRWGATLLGFTHGNEEKHAALPNLMASERPAEWAATLCHEWLIGHWHQTKAYITRPTEMRDSTVVRVLRSIAGTDAWHHRKGYINLQQAAEVYWYGQSRGYCGHAVAYARTK